MTADRCPAQIHAVPPGATPGRLTRCARTEGHDGHHRATRTARGTRWPLEWADPTDPERSEWPHGPSIAYADEEARP